MAQAKTEKTPTAEDVEHSKILGQGDEITWGEPGRQRWKQTETTTGYDKKLDWQQDGDNPTVVTVKHANGTIQKYNINWQEIVKKRGSEYTFPRKPASVTPAPSPG